MITLLTATFLSVTPPQPISALPPVPPPPVEHGLETRGDFVQVAIAAILNDGVGNQVVMLKTPVEDKPYVPVWIGEIEALNITLRMRRIESPRPMTLDLLESVMENTGVKLVEVKIDDLQNGVFLGKIVLKQEGKDVTCELDARPSDAMGLAAGAGVKIWMKKNVVERVGVSPGDLDKASEPPPNRPTQETL